LEIDVIHSDERERRSHGLVWPESDRLPAYAADGRMSVVIADSARKALSTGANSSMEERAAAFSTFISYAGTYLFNGDKVIHHIEVASIQNAVNTDQVRYIKLRSDV